MVTFVSDLFVETRKKAQESQLPPRNCSPSVELFLV